MVWNGKWNERCQNGMEYFKNGMEGNVHTSISVHPRFRALYLQKITYGFWVETNNIVTQKYSTSIFTGIICRLIAVV